MTCASGAGFGAIAVVAWVASALKRSDIIGAFAVTLGKHAVCLLTSREALINI